LKKTCCAIIKDALNQKYPILHLGTKNWLWARGKCMLKGTEKVKKGNFMLKALLFFTSVDK